MLVGGRGHSPRPRAFRGSTGVLQAARSRPQSPRSGHPESKLGPVCGAAFTALNRKPRFRNSGPIPVIEPDLVTNASTLDPFLTSKTAQCPESHEIALPWATVLASVVVWVLDLSVASRASSSSSPSTRVGQVGGGVYPSLTPKRPRPRVFLYIF